MFDPSLSIQGLIYDTLKAALPATVMITDSMDQAGFLDALPFVLIGDDVVGDDGDACGSEYTVRAFIRCHAQGPSRKDVKTLANDVRAAMWAANLSDSSDFVMNDNHEGTRSDHIEGIAHLAIVEWEFELHDDT